MATLSITEASVGVGSTDTQITTKQMGEAIGQGVVVYKDTTDASKLKIADMNTLLPSAAYGITIDGGADDDWTVVVTSGPYRVGATVTAGEMYYLAATGLIGQWADVSSSDYIVQIGPGISTTMINVDIMRVADSAGTPITKV